MKHVSKEYFLEEYCNKKRQKRDISRELDISVACINEKLKAYGIPNNKKPNYQTRDITGEKFGRLTAIERYENDKFGKAKWVCSCECSSNKIVTIVAASLIRGLTKSCGCIKKERMAKGYKDISASFWNNTIKSAFKRNIDFNLTMEEAWDIYIKQNGKCAISGVEIYQYPSEKRPEYRTASLDRIDSTKGYSIDNCQWVHKSVNFIKGCLDEKELFFWANKISEYRGIESLKDEEVDLTYSLQKRKFNYENIKENLSKWSI